MGEYILWSVLIVGMFPLVSLVALVLMAIIERVMK